MRRERRDGKQQQVEDEDDNADEGQKRIGGNWAAEHRQRDRARTRDENWR